MFDVHATALTPVMHWLSSILTVTGAPFFSTITVSTELAALSMTNAPPDTQRTCANTESVITLGSAVQLKKEPKAGPQDAALITSDTEVEHEKVTCVGTDNCEGSSKVRSTAVIWYSTTSVAASGPLLGEPTG
jgi:hypothetical protein